MLFQFYEFCFDINTIFKQEPNGNKECAVMSFLNTNFTFTFAKNINYDKTANLN